MALSKETLKNLFDLMQKVSLSTTVVSVALLSNSLPSHPVVEKEAQHELTKLMQIGNQEIGGQKIRALTSREIIEWFIMRDLKVRYSPSTIFVEGSYMRYFDFPRNSKLLMELK